MTVIVVCACIRWYLLDGPCLAPDSDPLLLCLSIGPLSLSGFTIAKVAYSQGAYNIIVSLIF